MSMCQVKLAALGCLGGAVERRRGTKFRIRGAGRFVEVGRDGVHVSGKVVGVGLARASEAAGGLNLGTAVGSRLYR